MSYRALAIVVATLGAVIAIKAWNSHLVDLGDARGSARIQTQWDTAEAKRRGDEKEAAARAATEQAEAERLARTAEQAKQKEAERIANDQSEREATLRASLGRAESRNRGLLDTINELNVLTSARAAADVSGTAQNTGTTGFAHEATAARVVLGSCSQRYTTVAAEAEGLRVQVIGLQAFVTDVCLAQKGN